MTDPEPLIRERLKKDRRHRTFVKGTWIIIASVILFALTAKYVG